MLDSHFPHRSARTTSTVALPSRRAISRLLCLLIVSLLFTLSFLHLQSHTDVTHYHSFLRDSASLRFPLRRDDEPTATNASIVQAVSEAYEIERLELLNDIKYGDGGAVSFFQGTDPGCSLSPDLTAYVNRLRRFTNEYFDGSPHHPYLSEMLDRLERHVPPPLLGREIPRTVFSTAGTKDDGLLDTTKEFADWERRLGGDGWDVRVGADEEMEEWFGVLTGGNGKGNGTAKWREVWDVLPKVVLKTDLIRYMIMLLNGGIYTDSDTQPRAHPYIWGHRATDFLPASLAPLTSLLRAHAPLIAAPPAAALSDPQATYSESYASHSRGGIIEPGVSLVASIEFDAVGRKIASEFGMHPDRWLGVFRRFYQIAQWTLMAKPYHPVMLDVLENVVRVTRNASAAGRLKDIGALDLTGPGPYTDALFRYLVVQYAVPPTSISGMTEAARIGDVILLPEWSFAQPVPQPDEWDYLGPKPDTRCVAHGFLGRWKGDGWDRDRE